MTREDLTKLTGEPDIDIDFALDIILKYLEPDFIKTLLNIELKNVNKRLSELRHDGYIKSVNGIDKVIYNPDIDRTKYSEATAHLYRRNRLMHILYHN